LIQLQNLNILPHFFAKKCAGALARQNLFGGQKSVPTLGQLFHDLFFKAKKGKKAYFFLFASLPALKISFRQSFGFRKNVLSC
jgi:hypothetical protein